MNFIRTVTSLLLLTAATYSYALDSRQESEREQRRQPSQQVLTTRSTPQTAYLTERQTTGQRRENQNIGEAPSGFTRPQTVSIDRLKLQSDTLAEYQFEPAPTMTLQGTESSPGVQDHSPAPSEATGEESQQEQEKADAESSPPEQSVVGVVEEVVESDLESPGDESVSEKLVTTGGGSSFRIIEDNNRIVVTQGDAILTAVDTAH